MYSNFLLTFSWKFTLTKTNFSSYCTSFLSTISKDRDSFITPPKVEMRLNNWPTTSALLLPELSFSPSFSYHSCHISMSLFLSIYTLPYLLISRDNHVFIFILWKKIYLVYSSFTPNWVEWDLQNWPFTVPLPLRQLSSVEAVRIEGNFYEVVFVKGYTHPMALCKGGIIINNLNPNTFV